MEKQTIKFKIEKRRVQVASKVDGSVKNYSNYTLVIYTETDLLGTVIYRRIPIKPCFYDTLNFKYLDKISIVVDTEK